MSKVTSPVTCDNMMSPTSPRFTSIRRSDSVSQYLEEYSGKRMEQTSDVGHDCHWTHSSALILAHQPWLTSHGDMRTVCGQDMVVDGDHVVACCALVVMEWRGENGMVKKSWEPFDEGQSKKTGIEDGAGGAGIELVIMASCGKIRKLLL